MEPKLTRRVLSLVLILGLFAIFCFLPDRLIIAGLLLIALMILLNLISFSPSKNHTKLNARSIDKYELAKSEWKKELEHDLNIQEIIKERNRQEIRKLRTQRSKPIQIQQKGIIRIVDQKASEELPYRTIKTRWRNELNDQAFENRIQTVFEKIRHESEPDYLQGIEEIKKLLVLRFNSLKQSRHSIEKPSSKSS